MTTAELIKKREEEQNKPSQETTKSVNVPPVGGMSMAEARMAGNGVPITETAASEVQAASTTTSPVSLYEIGKHNATANIGEAENVLKGKTPISTPEYEKFRNEVIGAQQFGVETPEQAAARERRDFIKQGLTGFTEGLSALANLYYTTKGAPSQKLTSQMPELSKRLYAERLERDKKLENFRAWQRSKADKEEERAYNLNLFNIKQEAANKAADKKAKIDAQAAQIKYLRDLDLIDAKQAADLEKMKGKFELDKELAKINNSAAMARALARSGENGGKGSNATIRVPIGDDGQYAEYRKNDLTNPIVISQIYNSLPDDYRVRDKNGIPNFPKDEKGKPLKDKNGNPVMEYPFDENPSTQQMQEAIGKALSDGYLTEMAPEIQVGGEKKGKKSKSLPGVESGEQKSKHLNL